MLRRFLCRILRCPGQFTTDVSISVISGLIIAFPYIAWQIWSFISPALYENERRVARGAVTAISLLFLTGILFGYYVIVPFSVHFLSTYTVSAEVANVVNLNSYFSTIASVTLASGLVFELPVFVYFLTKIGILTPGFMTKYRRHAIVILLIFAAVITPPDVFRSDAGDVSFAGFCTRRVLFCRVGWSEIKRKI